MTIYSYILRKDTSHIFRMCLIDWDNKIILRIPTAPCAGIAAWNKDCFVFDVKWATTIFHGHISQLGNSITSKVLHSLGWTQHGRSTMRINTHMVQWGTSELPTISELRIAIVFAFVPAAVLPEEDFTYSRPYKYVDSWCICFGWSLF